MTEGRKSILATLIVLVSLAFLAWWAYGKFFPDPLPPKPYDQGAVEVPKKGTIRIGSDKQPALPKDYRPKSGDRLITVKVKKPVAAGEDIVILVPKEKEAPIVLGDSGKAEIGTDTSALSVEYEVFKDPWFNLKPNVFLGASTDFKGVSPFVAATFLTLWERVHIGVGLDRFGSGPTGQWEFPRGFSAGLKWNAIKFAENRTDGSFTICLRL